MEHVENCKVSSYDSVLQSCCDLFPTVPKKFEGNVAGLFQAFSFPYCGPSALPVVLLYVR